MSEDARVAGIQMRTVEVGRPRPSGDHALGRPVRPSVAGIHVLQRHGGGRHPLCHATPDGLCRIPCLSDRRACLASTSHRRGPHVRPPPTAARSWSRCRTGRLITPSTGFAHSSFRQQPRIYSSEVRCRPNTTHVARQKELLELSRTLLLIASDIFSGQLDRENLAIDF